MEEEPDAPMEVDPDPSVEEFVRQRDWETIPPMIAGPALREIPLPEVPLQPCRRVLNADLRAWIIVSESSRKGYRLIRIIQDCIYGKVFEAVETEDPLTGKPSEPEKRFAVKAMELDDIARQRVQLTEDPYKEIYAMEWLKEPGSPNLLQLVECLSDGRTLYVVTPFCAGGDLFSMLIDNGGPMSEDDARPLFKQIVESIDYCHHKAICHHDVSVENTMLDAERTQCLLMDFGMSLHMPYTATGRFLSERDYRQGKQSCLAPECARALDYDGCAVDVFAAGSVLYMMLIGRRPWEMPRRTDSYFRTIILDGRLDYVLSHLGVNISEEVLELMMWMYRVDFRDRPSARQVLEHVWFGGTLRAPPLRDRTPPPPEAQISPSQATQEQVGAQEEEIPQSVEEPPG